MSKADFEAKVKEFKVINRVLADKFTQSIQVILHEVELTDENLLELRQFAPNEEVSVLIESRQANLFEAAAKFRGSAELYRPKEHNLNNSEHLPSHEEEEEFISFSETDDELPTGNVIKSFTI